MHISCNCPTLGLFVDYIIGPVTVKLISFLLVFNLFLQVKNIYADFKEIYRNMVEDTDEIDIESKNTILEAVSPFKV